MATASFSAAAEDDLSCPVCFNLFKDPHTPKELDCSHVFCAKCIQKMIEGGRRVVDCPECRHASRIPKKGVDAMKTAYRLRSLAEKHHEHATKAAKHQDDSDEPAKEKPVKGQDAESLCPEHNIIIDFFCKKCNVAGCSTCMMYDHQRKDHDVISIASAYSQQLEEIANIFGQISVKVDECAQSILGVREQETELIRQSKEEMERIENHLEAVIAKARENAHLLKGKFNDIQQPKIERACKEKERLEKQQKNLTDIKSSVENTLATSTRHKYVEQHAAISEKLISVLEKDCKEPEGLNPMVGKARLEIKQMDMKMGSVLQVKSVRLSQVQELGWNLLSGSTSIATSADGAVVVSFDNNVLHVYRRNQNGQYKREQIITLSKKVTKNEPVCVAVSANGKFLVVRTDVCIEVYLPSGQYEGVLTLKADPEGNGRDVCMKLKPCWLVVEEDGGLVISDTENNSVVQFTDKGIFKRSIATSVPPYQIAAMPNGKFAATNWRENKLVVFNGDSGTETLTVAIPNAMAICYHRYSDTLLLGRFLKEKANGDPDRTAGVIEQYCPTSGRLVKQFKNNGSIGFHMDMAITNDGLLISAEYHYVRAYKVTF